MVRKIKEIVDEQYDIFVLAYEKFEADNRWKGNFHFEWITCVAEMSKAMLIHERISEEQQKRGYNKQSSSAGDDPQDGERRVTIRLSDGTVKTKDVKDKIREHNFWWDTPKGSFDWNKIMTMQEWNNLKDKYPFKELTVTVEE